MSQKNTDWLIGLLIIIPILGVVLVDQSAGTLRNNFTPHTISFYMAAGFGWVLTLVIAEKWPRFGRWQIVWGIAIAARLLLLFTTPTLSDDVYRYLWDGHVAANGVSPYALPIDSPDLDYLDHPVRSQANNTWMASPYMPAAQWIFLLFNWIAGPSPFMMQLGMVLLELGAAAVIAKLLAMANYPPQRLMLWLWNPLVIVEVAHSAHIDAWMVLLMMAGVWLAFLPSHREANQAGILSADLYKWGSVLTMVFATLTKILPVLILPILFWRWNWWQRIGYGVLTLGLLIPYGQRAGWGLIGPLNGKGLFGALRIYNGQWKFNSGIFFWVTRWLNDGDGYTPSPADALMKQMTLVIVIIILLTVWWLAYRWGDLKISLRLMAIPLMAYLLLTPTVHPWYALILLPFLPFLAPSQDENKYYWLITAPWIYLSIALILSYMTYFDPNDFREFAWVRNWEWIPTLMLLTITSLFFISSSSRLTPAQQR
ncbi:MAG: hypothetical protein AAGD96_19690 [Chloroflexota bacterium]